MEGGSAEAEARLRGELTVALERAKQAEEVVKWEPTSAVRDATCLCSMGM
jgi:hypothetical protein